MKEEQNIPQQKHNAAGTDEEQGAGNSSGSSVGSEQFGIASNQPSLISQPQPNPQPQNMEVHKHPHHVTHKKKWGEYFLEFLMLFLAVFLGFVAENFREHQVEKQRGRQYIESFYEDLKTDTARLAYLIGFETKKIASLNALQGCYDSLLKNESPASLLDVIKNSLSNNPFLLDGQTLRQLTNAGGFRLLKKSDADSIINYEKDGNNLEEYQSSLYQQSQDNLRNTFNEVVNFIPYSKLYSDVTNNPIPDVNDFKTPLLSTSDRVLLNKYFNQLFQYLRVIVQHRNRLNQFKGRAVVLLEYFKNKYHLE